MRKHGQEAPCKYLIYMTIGSLYRIYSVLDHLTEQSDSQVYLGANLCDCKRDFKEVHLKFLKVKTDQEVAF